MGLLHVSPDMTAGELFVALATLALAYFAGWPVRRTGGLVEALDRPFVVPTSHSWVRGVRIEDGALLCGLQNLGTGLAVVEVVQLLTSPRVDLLDKPFAYQGHAIAPGGSVDIRSLLSTGEPGAGTRFLMRTGYISVSGECYVTDSVVVVEKDGVAKFGGHRLG